jgi:hypothetical protein
LATIFWLALKIAEYKFEDNQGYSHWSVSNRTEQKTFFLFLTFVWHVKRERPQFRKLFPSNEIQPFVKLWDLHFATTFAILLIFSKDN